MAKFKICVKIDKKRSDGYYTVYVRITHNRKIGYIKTDKIVNDQGLSKGEVIDPFVVKLLGNRICEWADALNRVDIDTWSVQDVVAYLKNTKNTVTFSEYCKRHRDRLINNGQERTERNYRWAQESLELFCGTNKVTFEQLTSSVLNAWIKSMEKMHRAKEMYPVCIRQVWRAAMRELNDEERGVMKIRNPWAKVDIPQADRTEKLAISAEQCREFFAAPLPESKFKSPLPELGRDVALMVLCLAGINTIDLYEMKKEDYYDGIIHYKRAKTKKHRRDEAYIEMRVPELLKPTFKKYLAEKDSPWLFCFHERHTTSDSFNANVNIGIRAICKSMGIAKEDDYCVYTFRHTWGTLAQNHCGASISEVAFAMNHSSGHTVTRGYLKLNFEPAWILNEKVVDCVFNGAGDGIAGDAGGDQQAELAGTELGRGEGAEPKRGGLSRFSGKHFMRGTAYYNGRVMGGVEDIGFNNVEEILRELYRFMPDDMPARAVAKFKVENIDKDEVAMYERMKGKSF